MSEVPSDLQAAWAEACSQFQKATGFDLAAVNAKGGQMNGADIVNKYNDRKAQIAKANEKTDKIKSVVGDTIRVLEGVGQIAATGASMVFGSPATITMGCISSLIDAGFEYKNIANNINDLFGRMASILERFQIYHNNEKVMDPAMIRLSIRLLIAVVNICKLCIVMLHRNKLRKFFEIALFSKDGGVRAQFAVLEELQKEESQMKGTLTYVVAETTKRDMASGFGQIMENEIKIADSVSKLNASSSEEKALRELKEKLGGDDSRSKGGFKAIQDQTSASTCSWLQEDTEYQSWSGDAEACESNVLLMQGDEGCGKTWALTAVIQDLLKRYPQARQDANRVSVAYYYPNLISKKDSKDVSARQGPSIAGILRDWAWQALCNDQFYRKAVAALLKEDPGLGGGDFMEIWEKLFLSHVKKEACSFFLLLDGMHELDEKELVKLSSVIESLLAQDGSNPGSIRILLSSRPMYIRTLTSQFSIDVTLLDLRKKSRDDMKSYIEEKASSLSIFQKKDSSRIMDLKTQACQGLLEAVDGDFNLAAKKLEEISNSHDPEEVMAIVQRTKEGGGLNASIMDDIRNCNRTLTSWDIKSLNALLLWVIYGEWYFQIWELDSILYIQQGRESLQPLYNDIKSKFSAFFRMTDEPDETRVSVFLKYDSIGDYFQNLTSITDSLDPLAPQNLTEGEIRTVQHFISKLCEPEAYKKLGLEQFFEQKLSQSNTGISVDCDNAHAIIAVDCMKTLLGEFATEADGLILYASNHLDTHLKNIDLDIVTPSQKAELGPCLIKAFKHQETIAKFHKPGRVPWSFKDEALSQVVRLLGSSAVIKRITEAEDRDWVKNVLESDTPQVTLLGETAKWNAELWLTTESGGEVIQHFGWLFGYYEKDSDTPRSEWWKTSSADIDDIEEIYEKVQKLLPNVKPSPHLYRNIGITFRECNHVEMAVKFFHKALELDPNYLLAHGSLAVAYGREVQENLGTGWKPDWEKAVEHQDIAIEALRGGAKMFSFEDAEDTLKFMLEDKARCMRKLGRNEESRKIYSDLLAADAKNNELRLQFIYALCEADCHDAVVDMLRDLGQSLDEETKQTHVSQFLHAHETDEDCHVTIFSAFKQAGDVDEIKGHYQKAVLDVKRDKTRAKWQKSNTSGYLLYYLAAMLYRHSTYPYGKEEAVKFWEQVVAMEKREGEVLIPQAYSARRLAKVYIGRALEADRESPVAREMLDKVRSMTTADDRSGNDDDDDDDDRSLGLSHAEVRSLLGRYYSAIGDIEEARKHLRPGIELGVKLLTDDDDANDWQAYRKLGDTLMDFGDDANAIAAWTLIQPTKGLEHYRRSSTNMSDVASDTEEGADEGRRPSAANGLSVAFAAAKPGVTADKMFKPRPGTEAAIAAENNGSDGNDSPPAEVSASPAPHPKAHLLRRTTTSRHLEGPMGYSCDGDCGCTWTYSDDLYVCRECIDVQFDAPCLEKLRAGEIHRDICDPAHAFMHVPAWDYASYQRTQRGLVLVGEREIEWQEWFDGIKREWGLMEEGEAEGAKAGVAVNGAPTVVVSA